MFPFLTSGGSGSSAVTTDIGDAVANSLMLNSASSQYLSKTFPNNQLSPTDYLDKIAVSPDGLHAYVGALTVGAGQGKLYQYSVHPVNGTFTALSTPSLNVGPAGYHISDVKVSPDNKHVYVITYQNLIYQYSRDLSTGLLTALSPATVSVPNTAPVNMSFSPDGNFLYVNTNGTSSVVYSFARNSTTGLLSAATSVISASGGSFQRVVISPDNAYAYVTNFNAGTVNLYSRNVGTGAFTALSPATVSVTQAAGLCISSDGLSVYATNQSANAIHTFTRNTGTGGLTANGTLSLAFASADIQPAELTITPDDKSIYVVYVQSGNTTRTTTTHTRYLNEGASAFAVLSRNTSGGALSYVGSGYVVPPGASGYATSGPTQVVATNSTVYAICGFTHVLTSTETITMYSRNASTGVLALVGPTSSNVYTFSTWVKRGKLSTLQYIFGASTNTSLSFTAADTLQLILGGTTACTSTAVFRDPVAWYHVVYAQNGSSNTLYVNNQIVATGTTNNTIFNANGTVHQVGALNSASFLDGYLAQTYFIDGQALDPSSFGRTSSDTSAWINKTYSGTYGTYGFYLPYTNSAALGTDSSGNVNTWTTAGGISSTNQKSDSPTNNFNVLNVLNKTTTATLSAGNTTASASAVAIGSIGMEGGGKYYWEVTSTGGTTTVGMYNTAATTTTTVTTGTTVGFRYDSSAGTFDSYNGSSWSSVATGLTATPYFTYVSTAAATTATVNSGASAFTYSAPSGYTALSTANMPTPAIKNTAAYFNADTYIGTGGELVVRDNLATPASPSYDVANSMMLDKASSQYLSRTFTTAVQPAGTGTLYTAISADGTSVYVTNYSSANVTMYSRNATTGALTSLGNIASGTNPYGIAVSPDGKSVYVCNYNGGSATTPTLQWYARNTSTGVLTSSGTAAVGAGPYRVIVSPDNNHVYVSCSSGTVYQFSRNTTNGQLTALSPASVTPSGGVIYFAMSPDGNSVYVGGTGTTMSQFARNSSTGLLSPLSPATVTLTSGIGEIIISPDNSYAYVASSTGVNILSRNTGTGALTLLSTYAMPSWSMEMTPDGLFLYASTGTNSTAIFSRNTGTGALTLSTATTSGIFNTHMSFSSDNKFAYASTYNGGPTNAVLTITRDTSTGALYLNGPTYFTFSTWVKRGAVGVLQNILGASTNYSLGFTAGDLLTLTLAGTAVAASTNVYRTTGQWHHVVYSQNNTESLLYVDGYVVATGTTANTVFNTGIAHQLGAANTSNYFDGYLAQTYFIDGQVLTPAAFGQTDSVTGQWLPKSYTGGNYGSNGFYLPYTTPGNMGVDSSTNASNWTVNGTYSALFNQRTGGTYPAKMVASPDSAFAYVINNTSNTISQFSRNTTTGELTALGTPTIATGNGPTGICMAADGTSVYVTNATDSTVSMYSRNTSTGLLTALGTPTISTGTSASPGGICISADGASVYAANAATNTIITYTRNTGTGALTVNGSTIGTGLVPNILVISADGKNVYCTDWSGSSNNIYIFNRNTSTGVLTFSTSIATGTNPVGLCIAPDGTSMYAADSGAATLHMYSRNTSTGALAALGTPTIAAGTTPTALTISTDGLYVYVTNAGSANTTMYSRNTGTGALTSLGTVNVGTTPVGIALTADNNFVYVTNAGSNTVSVLARNPSTGLLSYSASKDTPTHSYATLNNADKNASGVMSVANTKWQSAAAAQYDARATLAIPTTGKYYFEGKITTTTSASVAITFGVALPSVALTAFGNTAGMYVVYASNTSNMYINGVSTGSAGGVWTAGDTLQCAVDATNKKIWFGKNNTWWDSGFTTTGNPAAGTNACYSFLPVTSGLLPFVGAYSNTITMNFGANGNFEYTPPTGFVALQSANVASVINFAPDLIWLKSRSAATDHCVVDSHRGLDKLLVTDATSAEIVNANIVQQTLDGGYVVGNDSKVNTAAATYVGWSFKESITAGIDLKLFTAPGTAASSVTVGTNPLGSCVSPDGNHVYICNAGSATVSMYIRDNATVIGALTLIGTVATSTTPRSICISPDGNNVYVANNGGTTIQAYSRNATTGVLTSISAVPNAVAPYIVTISPDGLSVYAVNLTSNNVTVFARDTVSGMLTSYGTIATGTGPAHMVVSPDGLFAYVLNYTAGNVSQFSRNTTTGVLSPLGTPTIAAGTNPQLIAISPDGAHIYVANYGSAGTGTTVLQFSRNAGTGLMAALSPASVTVGTGPLSMVVSPDGLNVYVGNYTAAGTGTTVSQLSRNTSTGLLTALSPATVTSAAGPVYMCISPDGVSVYVSCNNNGTGTTVSLFSRGGASGLLTALSTSVTTCLNPITATVSPDNNSVYLCASGVAQVAQFSRNTVTGSIKALGTPSVATSSATQGLCISPDGLHAYASNVSSASIAQFSRNTTTGALTALSPATISTGAGPVEPVISADGLHVYVANSAGTTVSQFSRNPSTGLLTALTPATVTVGNAPNGVCISADGAHVYVSNYNGGAASTLSQLSRNSGSGLLTALGTPTIATGAGPADAVVSPDGLSVYVCNYGTGAGATIQQFIRNPATGLLSNASSPTVATGSGPVKIVVSPDNLNVYVTNLAGNTVQMYSRVAGTSLLTSLGTIAATGAYGIAIAPDGKNVYATQQASTLAYVFTRNTATGILYNIGTANMVAHSLGAAPSMVIAKCRGATSEWSVYHKSLTTPSTDRLVLNTTGALATVANTWINTTSSNVGMLVGTNAIAGQTGIMYSFVDVPGFSKFGSYTGNGSADGPFVYCGFKPHFVMVKRADAVSDWRIADTARDVTNVAAGQLYADLASAEASGALVDITASGFKLRQGAGAGANESAGTYIYAAFAEIPFKYSNAR